MEFSSENRDKFITQFNNQEFDILVIGGGITGAGIALDAAIRGLKVALIEKNDFAHGTSSRSTKLIHGGLRYLKQLEFGIVRETGHERAILYKNAPHIVYPEKMLLPIIDGGSLGRYSTSLGLYMYDRLAGVKRDERRFMLNKTKTLSREPMLKEEILLGGGVYIEYRSDDARLVIEVLKTAQHKGALSLNYIQAESLLYSDGKVVGAKVKDKISGKSFDIKAKKVINAAGPWVDELRKSDKSLEGKRLHLTKGVHIVISKDRLPIGQAVYFDVTTDGRMVFAIPRQDIVYLGTTDTNYSGDTDKCYAEKEDVEYILNATNFIFPSANLSMDDVQSTWAGLRPLIHEDGKSPSELSRKDEIFISESGLISMAGGKLTGYRKMAKRAVDRALIQMSRENGTPFVRSSTKNVVLSGGDILGEQSIRSLINKFVSSYGQYDKKEVKSLTLKYGSNALEILENADKYKNSEYPLLLSEIDYSIENEMCQNISDFVIRRTGRLYFERPSLEQIYPLIHQHIVQKLKRSEKDSKKELLEFKEEYQSVMRFKN